MLAYIPQYTSCTMTLRDGHAVIMRTSLQSQIVRSELRRGEWR